MQHTDGLPTKISDKPAGAESTGRFTLVASGGNALRLDTPARAYLVGSGSVCDLRLPDPQVSRRHLSAVASDRGVVLRDLGSTNGTFLDGVRVIELLAIGGERITLGDTTLHVRRVAAVERPAERVASSFGALVGRSAAMLAIYPLCEKIAHSDVTVLIEGETGTGKEVLAESIHEQSARRQGPFVVFDCTATTSSLLESEIFGHERGAFTGAVAAREGVFEQAHGGTLLIDEIGDLDLALQAKLLRVVERREFRRLGGRAPIRVDVRLLTATRRDLDQEVQRGRFRDDLFHRLAVARIELPPLRRRQGDLRLLVQKFCAEVNAPPTAIPYDVLVRWESAGWPGNVRELRNAVARYIALGDHAFAPRKKPALGDDSFEAFLGMPLPLARQQLVDAFESAYVARVLAEHGGNIEAAAQASGLARRQFFRLKSKAKRTT